MLQLCFTRNSTNNYLSDLIMLDIMKFYFLDHMIQLEESGTNSASRANSFS